MIAPLTTEEKIELRIYGDASLPTLVYLPGMHGDWTLIGGFRAALVGRVRFVEMTPPTRFAWQWHPGAVDPKVDYSREPRTTVTFTLEPSATGTRLSVAETGFDAVSLTRRAKVYGDNSQGWAEVLVWVQKHAEAAG